MKVEYRDVFRVRQGWMGAAWSARGLRGLALPRRSRRAVEQLLGSTFGAGRKDRSWPELRRQVKSYLKGERRTFELPLDLPAAGPFTERVRQVVARIPYGTTASYGDVARRAGSSGAARAVGSAMARNPAPLVIPCHRVTAADGLGGFSPSVDLKAELLGIEARGINSFPGTGRKRSGAARK